MNLFVIEFSLVVVWGVGVLAFDISTSQLHPFQIQMVDKKLRRWIVNGGEKMEGEQHEQEGVAKGSWKKLNE